MASPIKLMVILGENSNKRLVLPNGMPKSVSELSQEIKTRFGVQGDFRLQYMDAEFGNKFMDLDSTSDVEDKGTIKLITPQTDTMSASKPTAEPAGNTRVQLDMEKFTEIKGDAKLPTVRLLKLERAVNSQLNKKVFGIPPTQNQSNKTIMVVGATGSGKTTLINAMINYVLGVEWEDNWRYKLINEQTNKTQADSQTSEVTAYEIYNTDGFKVPFSLTIIDTPGYGDTRGIKQDKEITEKIRTFFTAKGGIDRIDAVCFVVQSALVRLTPTQKYIFDAILSIFGKDIATNIVVLVTFADGQTPPVLEAIRAANIPCAKIEDDLPRHFKFNNSALSAKNTGANNDEGDFAYMYWKMGKASMNTFFTHLYSMSPQSLTLTKEVLNERRQLEATVDGVQPIMQLGLLKLEEINKKKAALQYFKTHMKANEKFTVDVQKPRYDEIDIPIGTYITNCLDCKYTCHYPCVFAKDADKIRCSAMTNGKCRICPKNCIWSRHVNVPYKLELNYVTETMTLDDLKREYETAKGGKMTTEQIIKRLEVEHEQVKGQVAEMMRSLTKCLQRLRDIALCPDPLATTEYIDLLIQMEKREKKPGYMERNRELEEVKERARLLEKMAEEGEKKNTSSFLTNVSSACKEFLNKNFPKKY